MQKVLALAAVMAHLSDVEKDLRIAWAGRPMPEAIAKQASAIRKAIEKTDGELESLLNRLVGPVWGEIPEEVRAVCRLAGM